jgi:Domain of unknown function (DUF1330)
MKILAMNGSHEDLEGAPSEDSEIIEFPSVEAAKVWYDSSLYREVGEHRFKGVSYRVTLVEGIRRSGIGWRSLDLSEQLLTPICRSASNWDCL